VKIWNQEDSYTYEYMSDSPEPPYITRTVTGRERVDNEECCRLGRAMAPSMLQGRSATVLTLRVGLKLRLKKQSLRSVKAALGTGDPLVYE
jgi:hypothetical protein